MMVQPDLNFYSIAKNNKNRNRRRRRRNNGARSGPSFTSLPSNMGTLGRQGFPKKLMVHHKYVDKFTLSVGEGLFGVFLFSCNGMYDPNITGFGHQPVYFDEVSAVYDHYTVFRSSIVLEIPPTTVPINAGIYIDDDTSTASGTFNAGEQATSSLHVFPSTAVKPLVLRKSWNAKEYFGGDIFDNDRLSGDTANNPAEQSYFTFYCEGTTGAGFNLSGIVKIEYEAVWDELRTITES